MAGALDMFKKKGGGGAEQEQAKEDPIAKAEREFFEIIKKVAGQSKDVWSNLPF